jgi:hypothetical protein
VRRRIAILLTLATAMTVIGLGVAMSASAQSNILKTVHNVTARFQSVSQADKAGYVPF